MSAAERGANGQGDTDWTVESTSAPESLDRAKLARIIARVALNRLVERRLDEGAWARPCSSNRVSNEDLSSFTSAPS